MTRPSFQFYPADWKVNANLRRCSIKARGAWIEVLCLLHDMSEYGICRWSLKEIAKATSTPIATLKELAEKGVLKGSDEGAEQFTYTPYHAGKHGETVVLIKASSSPLWYCSRFVRDEYKRQNNGKATRFSSENQPSKQTPNPSPSQRQGERQVDGSSSSTSSSSSNELTHSSETRNIEVLAIADSVCLELKNIGFQNVNPRNPRLIAMLEVGASFEEIISTAQNCKVKTLPYLLGTVEGIRKQVAEEQLTTGKLNEFKKNNAWRNSDKGIMDKSKSLGIGTHGLSKAELLAKIDSKMERKSN